MEYALFPIVLFGLSWIAVAFTTAAIYHAKGRSDWAGMAWGILFGWLALIYAVAMPTDFDALNERARAAGIKKECPTCYQYVTKRANVCPYCAQRFSDGVGYPDEATAAV